MIRYARVRTRNEGIYVGRKCYGYPQSPEDPDTYQGVTYPINGERFA